ncbi:hypothetical protein EG68_04896 [Paragonimus skrjabini miyazakii]|uniref:Uncharacterized protein n=1 Tax=Paragonimus skrjabini miyazakii TaxID=59628 RepID=A0A8S9YT38_9TREM|nr:hypothetical protein EG68_04896 [Paragonimus skrjabini miyazakii]
MSSLELLVHSMAEYLDPTTSSHLNGRLELERGELDRVRHLAHYQLENAKTILTSLSTLQHLQSGADSFKRVRSIYLHHNYKVGLSPEDVRAVRTLFKFSIMTIRINPEVTLKVRHPEVAKYFNDLSQTRFDWFEQVESLKKILQSPWNMVASLLGQGLRYPENTALEPEQRQRCLQVSVFSEMTKNCSSKRCLSLSLVYSYASFCHSFSRSTRNPVKNWVIND